MDRDPANSIATALDQDPSSVVVVYYPDFGLRSWIRREVATIAGVALTDIVDVDTADAAIKTHNKLVLLFPHDEAVAVAELDALRDRMLEPPRTHPVVLFLVRGGDGEQALTRAPHLASWVRGRDPDPDALAEVPHDKLFATFLEDAGSTPKEWLAKWGRGELEDGSRTRSLLHLARLLERT